VVEFAEGRRDCEDRPVSEFRDPDPLPPATGEEAFEGSLKASSLFLAQNRIPSLEHLV